MPSHRASRVAGLAVAALALAGCGEDPGIEEGVVPPKGTDTSSLAPLRDAMIKNMRNRSYLKKGEGPGPPPDAPEGSTGPGTGAASAPAPKGG